ncbi:MAG: hypothetical protein WCT03_19085 [Candidatus Obscuribacterales bacterium]|jgi:hypothetical protein
MNPELPHNPYCDDPALELSFQEVELGSKIEGELRTTFHVYKSDRQIGYYLEKVYTSDDKLVKMVKRSADGRSETRFDPITGDIDSIFESYTLPDGNILTKDKRYLSEDQAIESVLVMNPKGILVRTVVRETQGQVNSFQGQTEFGPDGKALFSVNHWFDAKSGKMNHREQIQWLSDGQRGVTEHFHFSDDGALLKYFKRLYHPSTDRYLEETHIYDAITQLMLRKETKTSGRLEVQMSVEVITYDKAGNAIKKQSNILDKAAL